MVGSFSLWKQTRHSLQLCGCMYQPLRVYPHPVRKSSRYCILLSEIIKIQIRYWLSDIVDQDIVKISRTTYFKGMKEWVDKKFIAENSRYRTIILLTNSQCLMVISLTFMKTYYLKDKKTKTKREQMLIAGKHVVSGRKRFFKQLLS